MLEKVVSGLLAAMMSVMPNFIARNYVGSPAIEGS